MALLLHYWLFIPHLTMTHLLEIYENYHSERQRNQAYRISRVVYDGGKLYNWLELCYLGPVGHVVAMPVICVIVPPSVLVAKPCCIIYKGRTRETLIKIQSECVPEKRRKQDVGICFCRYNLTVLSKTEWLQISMTLYSIEYNIYALILWWQGHKRIKEYKGIDKMSSWNLGKSDHCNFSLFRILDLNSQEDDKL